MIDSGLLWSIELQTKTSFFATCDWCEEEDIIAEGNQANYVVDFEKNQFLPFWCAPLGDEDEY